MDNKKYKSDNLYNWLTCPVPTSGLYKLLNKENRFDPHHKY